MRSQNQNKIAIFLCLTGILVICLIFLSKTAFPANNQISISKDTNFVLDPDPNEVYNHIMVKIKPYKTFRLSLKVYMDDDTYLWISYAPTSSEPFQEYEGGPIHIGLDAALIDKEVHIIDLDLNLDLESFVVSELRSIQEVEILGNRFDLFYIIAYRESSDDNKVIDNFDLPGQDIGDRGWESTTMDQFSISFDSESRGYLKAEYTITDDPNNEQDDNTTIYPYYGYGYPYNIGSYYGNTIYGGYYGSGYYGGGYYGAGYYGGGYYGSGYYGGGYYGGGYYGGGYYGSGYYGGGYYGAGYYGGFGGVYGGLYGGLGLGLYGGLYGGLSTYFGGPIGLFGGYFGGLLGAFV